MVKESTAPRLVDHPHPSPSTEADIARFFAEHCILVPSSSLLLESGPHAAACWVLFATPDEALAAMDCDTRPLACWCVEVGRMTRRVRYWVQSVGSPALCAVIVTASRCRVKCSIF
jgi:hypothetical protein